jgi:hypothetical protein
MFGITAWLMGAQRTNCVVCLMPLAAADRAGGARQGRPTRPDSTQVRLFF